MIASDQCLSNFDRETFLYVAMSSVFGYGIVSLLKICCVSFFCSKSFYWWPFAGPGQFTITSVTIGTDRDFISVTFVQVSHVRL